MKRNSLLNKCSTLITRNFKKLRFLNKGEVFLLNGAKLIIWEFLFEGQALYVVGIL